MLREMHKNKQIDISTDIIKTWKSFEDISLNTVNFTKCFKG